MKVLVTGAVGFIGSHLVRRLSKKNEVILLDNMSRAVADADVVRADITSDISRHFKDVDVVYHLAAMSSVRISEQKPERCFLWNVYGTYNVVKACVDNNVKKIVFSSSREVYGDQKKIPVRESAGISPKNVYGYSKVMAEGIVQQLCNQNTKYTIFRIANVYGPGDRDRLIPLLLEKLKTGKEFRIFGGEQLLDLIYIDDVCDAMIDYAKENRILNLGTGIGTGIDDVIALVEKLAGKKLKRSRVAANDYEVTRFVADITEIGKLGFKPKVKLEQGIRKLIR